MKTFITLAISESGGPLNVAHDTRDIGLNNLNNLQTVSFILSAECGETRSYRLINPNGHSGDDTDGVYVSCDDCAAVRASR